MGGRVGKVSHYRDTFIGGEPLGSRNYGLAEIRGGQEEGRAGGGFFKGQGIQSQARTGRRVGESGGWGGGPRGFHSGSRFFRLILLSLTRPVAHLTANRVVSDVFISPPVNITPAQQPRSREGPARSAVSHCNRATEVKLGCFGAHPLPKKKK